MNLIGKIFIVLIFVMSLVWMGFTVAVYATHENWKETVENDLRPQLEQRETRNQELKDQLANLSEQIATEKAQKRDALTKLENEKRQLQARLDGLAEENATLVKSEADALSRMRALAESEEALRVQVEGGTAPDGTEVPGLRKEIAQAETQRDDYFDQVVTLTDELHQMALKYKTLRKKVDTLAADLAKANEVLRKHGLEPEPARYTGVPPIVEGVVLSVGEDDMLEISIGSDDGLMKGHKLEVVRQSGGQSTYLGRIEVVETAPDKSVCKILPRYLQRPIQRNDRVTSKLTQ